MVLILRRIFCTLLLLNRPIAYAAVSSPEVALDALPRSPPRVGLLERDKVDTEPTCELGDSAPASRPARRSELARSAVRRAPVGESKLKEPGRGAAQFADFMKDYEDEGEQLYIWPSPQQYNRWRVDYGGKSIPIGATGVYHDFGNKPQTFVMQGLTGCTAMFAISSHGIWAGHLWEASKAPDGPGSFTWRFRKGADGTEPRDPKEFTAIAVDILGQITPGREKAHRPLWKSLADVQQDNGDPFKDGADTDTFVLTKALSAQNRRPMYEKQLDPLNKKLKSLLPGTNFVQKTYLYNDPKVMDTNGLVVVQYTPYQELGGEDHCTPQARVRVFYENNRTPVIDKKWSATNAQLNSKRRRDACGAPDDWPIKTGYVAFGDSFAAGMGTGVTTQDSCRIGSANIGDLIHSHTANASIDYQRKMCSGDTVVGLNRQIDEWKNPEKTDLATVTMGGNDLGFSEIVMNCVLVPNPWHWASYYRGKCNAAKAKARQMLEDTSNKGIGSKLADAYKSIVLKADRAAFSLYVSGYPGGFFRDDDAQPVDCKNTIFNYWKPTYCPHWYQGCYSSDNVYLTVALRQELNGLVVKLNQVTSKAVDDVNRELGSKAVHFVDVMPYFDNHRWCEKSADPQFHEPDENRADTWYFLSGWKDVDATSLLGALAGPDSSLVNATNDVSEVHSLVEKGKIELPPAKICEVSLGTDPDPWDKWKCMISQQMADDPQGPWATKLKEANADIAAKDYNAESIGWFTPTRQVKTFHPRTPGMQAYQQSLVDAINKVQASRAKAVPP